MASLAPPATPTFRVPQFRSSGAAVTFADETPAPRPSLRASGAPPPESSAKPSYRMSQFRQSGGGCSPAGTTRLDGPSPYARITWLAPATPQRPTAFPLSDAKPAAAESPCDGDLTHPSPPPPISSASPPSSLRLAVRPPRAPPAGSGGPRKRPLSPGTDVDTDAEDEDEERGGEGHESSWEVSRILDSWCAERPRKRRKDGRGRKARRSAQAEAVYFQVEWASGEITEEPAEMLQGTAEGIIADFYRANPTAPGPPAWSVAAQE